MPTACELDALRTLSRSVSTMLALRDTGENLRESEERHRLIVSTARDAVITLDARGRIVTWNGGAEVIFGREGNAVIGTSFAPLVFESSALFHDNEEFLSTLSSDERARYWSHTVVNLVHFSNQTFRGELSAARLQTRGGEMLSLFIRDLTEHEHNQELQRDAALREVTIFAMAKLAESRDPETGAHIERVQHYCKVLAQELAREGPYTQQIDDEFIHLMYTTSPLHDIGKVGIPDAVLLKPGRLTDREFEIMKRHTQIGADTLAAAAERFPNTRFLLLARNIAATHHERFDGTGYPAGLKGTDIPICGRIMALADVYDALTSRRVYKAAMSHDIARGIILSEAGKHFDPAIVAGFERCEAEFKAICNSRGEALQQAA